MWLKLSAVLMLAYPLMAQLTVWLGKPEWLLGIVIGILMLLTVDRFSSGAWKVAMLLVGCTAGLSFLLMNGFSMQLIYLPPILIPLGLFILFSQTLRSNQTPLITRYAQLIDGQLDEERLSYTRKLTLVWSALFFVMVLENIALSLFASITVWSWFTHVFNYVLVGIFIVAEYVYRKSRFGPPKKGGFRFFISQLVRNKPGQLAGTKS